MRSVFFGGSNYIGDIGPTTYISPNEPAIGVLYKWNKSPDIPIDFLIRNLKLPQMIGFKRSKGTKGYRFENNLKVSLGLEFNFFDFNLHESSRKISPYVASGLSYFLAKIYLDRFKTDTSVHGRTERKNQ
jgi:hypothetical protein